MHQICRDINGEAQAQKDPVRHLETLRTQMLVIRSALAGQGALDDAYKYKGKKK
eukprot:XP_001708174.1 Hypothetical protein GL50803_22478 [Giardia lamblia ATCC 50803]